MWLGREIVVAGLPPLTEVLFLFNPKKKILNVSDKYYSTAASFPNSHPIKITEAFSPTNHNREYIWHRPTQDFLIYFSTNEMKEIHLKLKK